jgi:hypothetical protein
MNPLQVAQTITAALEESQPARLIELARTGELVKFLRQQAEPFYREYARQMEGQPKGAQLYILEGLMPMLTEFPPEPRRTRLTAKDRKLIEDAQYQYAEEAFSPENPPAATSG